jgi:signal transduction histidine kinase
MAEGNARRAQAALRDLQSEYESFHLVVYDDRGKAIGWTTALGLSSLGLEIDAGTGGSTTPEPQMLHGDLALIYQRPVDAAGEMLGSFRLAILLGRLFVSRASKDIDRPLALHLDGRTVHSSFRTDPPPPAPLEATQKTSEDVARLLVTDDGSHQVAWIPYGDGAGTGRLWLGAGTSRAPLKAARGAFLQLIGLVLLGGLLVVLGVVGAFSFYRWNRERQLIRQRDEAVGRSEGLSHKVADLTAVVHDIKAPVGGIQMLCEGLAESVPDAETREALERVVDTCERLSLFLVNVLTAAQVEEGPLEPRHETVLVAGLIDEVIERLEPIARRKSVRLTAGPETEAVAPLSGDSTLLERALVNLAANALEVSPQGGTVRLDARAEGHEVVLIVEDEGPGFGSFPVETAFSRSRPAVKHDSIRAGSSGLGLYIVRRIAEAHGGRTFAENRPEGGARVAFTVPSVAR